MTNRALPELKRVLEPAIKRGEFQLSSGAKSNYYINCRNVSMTKEGLTVIGEAICRGLAKPPLLGVRGPFVAIGGPESAAIPLVCAAVGAFETVWPRRDVLTDVKPISGFYVRKDARLHGTKSSIEGYQVQPGDEVVLCDDVVTSGDSLVKAIEVVMAARGLVQAITCLVDRLAGAAEIFRQMDIPFRPLLTINDFGL